MLGAPQTHPEQEGSRRLAGLRSSIFHRRNVVRGQTGLRHKLFIFSNHSSNHSDFIFFLDFIYLLESMNSWED